MSTESRTSRKNKHPMKTAMKQWTIRVPLSLITLLLYMPAFAQTPAASEKKITVSPDIINLGDITQEYTTASFEITNNTDKTVYVLESYGSCSCIKVECEDKVIPPQKTVKVKVTYHDRGKIPFLLRAFIVTTATYKPSYVRIIGNHKS